MSSAVAALVNPGGEEIAREFSEHFDVLIADTASMLDAAYRLRYQVYCVENAFETAAEHPDGREIDREDDRAVHSLIVHRRTGLAAGTVRLILPDGNPIERPLPMQRLLEPSLRARLSQLPTHATAEISRFAVSKQFRRRRGEERYPDVGLVDCGEPGAHERRLMPYLTYGLLRAILHMSAEHDITHVCAVMEPALLRLVGHIGFQFELLGSPVHHHGIRQPCFGKLSCIIEKIRSKNPGLWRYMTGFTVATRLDRELVHEIAAA